MIVTGLTTIKIVLSWISSSLLLLSASFGFWELWNNCEEQNRAQKWFGEKWEIISASPFLDMPENVIRWLLLKINNLSKIIIRYGSKKKIEQIGVIMTVAISIIWLILGSESHVKQIASWIIVIGLYLAIFMVARTDEERPEMPKLFRICAALWIAISFLIALFGGIATVMATPIGYAFIIMTSLLLCWYFIVYTVLVAIVYVTMGGIVEDLKNKTIIIFSIGMVLSFAVTIGSLWFGHKCSPQQYVPKTIQILLINTLCDGLTLVVTFKLLDWAIKSGGIFRILSAIIIDTVVAGLLAAGSLYLGLALSPHVKGRPKPATVGAFKTSHFEVSKICHKYSPIPTIGGFKERPYGESTQNGHGKRNIDIKTAWLVSQAYCPRAWN